MDYYHYTDYELKNLRDNIKQKNYKPTGLWLSQDTEWAVWCHDNGFQTCDMDNCYIYKIKIKKDNLCIISTLEELRNFSLKYRTKEDLGESYEYVINWPLVARDYDGICFENYYDIKNSLFRVKDYSNIWFYAIDINSACLWNPSKVITSIEIVAEKF